jgi:hypothetical protein
LVSLGGEIDKQRFVGFGGHTWNNTVPLNYT